MKREIKRLLVVAAGVWLLTGCCWTDHSETIKKVAEPMAKELERFYMEHKRFPTDKERDAMLERVGCKVSGDVCRYKGKKMIIHNRKKSYNYKIRIDLENTGCFFGISKSGQHMNVLCSNAPCVDLGQ